MVAAAAHRTVTLAHFSDTHVVPDGDRVEGRVDSGAMLAAAVDAAARMDPPPDALLLSGDLADHGSPAEYARLRTLLAPLVCPVFALPGNHDAREPLRAAFADQPWAAPAHDPALAPFVQFTADLGGLRLIGLDSVVPGAAHGVLCTARLAWLARTLAAAPDVPTLVALHHPPFATGVAAMDDAGLREGAAELEAIVARHPQVERVLAGHVHRPIQRRFGGTLALTAPSTAHQIVLDLRPTGACCLVMEPPGFLVHRFDGHGVVSHQVVVGDWGPAVPF